MIVQKYLVVNSRGNVTIREKEPRMAGNEFAVKLVLDVPDALFSRPILVAKMAISKEAIPKSSITPTITDNVEKLIKEATGLEMRVSIVEHENEKEDGDITY